MYAGFNFTREKVENNCPKMIAVDVFYGKQFVEIHRISGKYNHPIFSRQYNKQRIYKMAKMLSLQLCKNK